MTPSSHNIPKFTFPWEECEQVCEDFVERAESMGHTATFCKEKRIFEAGPESLEVPRVFPIPKSCSSLPSFLEQLPIEPGLQVVLLMQAGAASLGLFEAGEVLRTKTFKRYVVRGKGRAQPTHLNSKGKSRYGSRLRLQNARAILDETNEKLHDWWDEYGVPDTVFFNAPVRLWADLKTAKPTPPFAASGQLVRIPQDLPVPTTDVMLRAYRSLCYGRITTTPKP